MQIVRCPRPKSDKWPKVGQQAERPGNSKRSQSAAGGLIKQQQKSVWDVPLLQSASRPPDRVSAEATEEVQRLEAALSALGEGNPHAKPLVEALRVARAKAKVLLLEEQIIACKNFVERARKRVGGGRHLQSPRTEGGVRDGSAGRRSVTAASRVSHRVTTQNRRLDTRTRPSEGGHPESAPRSVDGRWSASCGVNSSNPHVF